MHNTPEILRKTICDKNENFCNGNHFIQIVSGEFFSFTDPLNSNFTIEDIAHALSNVCRYSGHSNEFYSVAQHSVLVSQVVPPEHALLGLMHDATEAFLSDIPSPLKKILPDYCMIEKYIETCILTKFNLPTELPPDIKVADLRVLVTEKKSLLLPRSWGNLDLIEPLDMVIIPLPPKEAKQLFLDRWYELNGPSQTSATGN